MWVLLFLFSVLATLVTVLALEVLGSERPAARASAAERARAARRLAAERLRGGSARRRAAPVLAGAGA